MRWKLLSRFRVLGLRVFVCRVLAFEVLGSQRLGFN